MHIERISLGAVGSIAIAASSFTLPAQAQSLILDGTTGPAQTLTGPLYEVTQALGTTAGTNLFHSFEQFNLELGELAFFSSSVDIRNIFARVTGGSSSSIDGLLLAPDVNFFLLNPAGVLFGPNASISVGETTRGSFTASTFDGFVWPNGGQFNARLSEATAPLLTLSGNPSHFSAGNSAPADIRFQGSNVAMAAEQSLLLLGGNIDLNDSQLSLLEGHAQFAAAQQGPIPLSFEDQQPRLGPLSLAPASTTIRLQDSAVDVSGPLGGRVDFSGSSIELDASRVVSGVTQRGTEVGDAVQIEPGIRFDASEQVLLQNGSGLVTLLGENAVGSSGPLQIETGLLSLQESSVLGTIALGNGRSGTIEIMAERVTIGAESGLSSSLIGFGEAGDITLSAQSLQMREGLLVSAVLLGIGQAGDINLEISGPVEIQGNGMADSGGLFSLVSSGIGEAGDINLNAGSLSLGQGGQIRSTVQVGTGIAGNINLTTEGDMVIDGQGSDRNATLISSDVLSGLGDGGNVTLQSSGTFQLLNGAKVETRSNGLEPTGDIAIEAAQDIKIDGGAVNTTAFDLGNAGNVSLFSSQGNVLLSQGGVLSLIDNRNSSASGGDIAIEAETIRLDNRFFLSSASVGQAGNAGTISLRAADSIELDNGSGILAVSFGAADSGQVNLFAGNSIALRKEAGVLNGIITARSLAIFIDEQGETFLNAADAISADDLDVLRDFPEGSGFAEDLKLVADTVTIDGGVIASFSVAANGGNIQLEASDSLLLRNGGGISAGTEIDTSASAGNGGNIFIETPFVIAVPQEDSNISTNAVNGIGGDIRITTQGLFGIQFRPEVTPLSDITASSEFGLDGRFTLDTPGLNPAQDLSELPTNLVDPSQQIAQSCASTASRSSLINTGRNGIPLNPDDAQTLSITQAGWATLPTFIKGAAIAASRQINASSPRSTVIPAEVTHWQSDDQGNIVLTASRPTDPTLHSSSCTITQG